MLSGPPDVRPRGERETARIRSFLGVEELTFHQPVYPGDTLTAASTVVDKRDSESRPNVGIVTWHTRGYNQRGEMVIDFRRSNFVRKEGAHA